MSTTYLITSIFLCIVLMIIIKSIRERLTPGGDNWFVSHILVGVTFLYVIMDCLWLMEYLNTNTFNIGLFTFLNLLFYLTYITLPVAWFCFSLHFLKKFKNRHFFFTVCMIPWLINVILIACTMLGTGFLWTLTDSSVLIERYVRGPMFGLFSKICLFYYFVPVFMTLYYIVKNEERRRLLDVLIFSAIPAIAVFIPI